MMKKLLALFALSLSLSLSVKADYWTQKANFPGFKRNLPISFSIGSWGYVGWGTDTQNISVKDFWGYNSLTNSWTQKATFQGQARSGAACYADPVNGKGYAGLGQNTIGTFYQDWYQYDPATNAWTPKATFTGGLRTLACGVFVGAYGYVGMGVNSSNVDANDLWQYDAVGNQWISKNPLPSYGRHELVTFAVAGKAYFALGYNNALSSSLLDIWEYDPAVAGGGLWTAKNSFYGDARYGAAAFTVYNQGYVGIGKTINQVYAVDFWRYNPFNDNWYQKADFGGPGRLEAAWFAINDTGYIGLGGSPGTFYRDLWKYSPDTLTGINELEASALNFDVYPNPASEFIVCNLQSSVNKNSTVTITDISGRKVYEQHQQA
ncbi:MAG: hypothetical protein ABIT08_07845, partial [Bacteroidia bacterium]